MLEQWDWNPLHMGFLVFPLNTPAANKKLEGGSLHTDNICIVYMLRIYIMHNFFEGKKSC